MNFFGSGGRGVHFVQEQAASFGQLLSRAALAETQLRRFHTFPSLPGSLLGGVENITPQKKRV